MATAKNKKGRAVRKGKKIRTKGLETGVLGTSSELVHQSPIPSPQSPVPITPEMRIAEVVAILPGAERLMAEYGLHCANCSLGGVDTLGAGARSHGFTDADVAQLIDDLNELLRDTPQRPMTITVTLPAATALASILKQEGQEDAVLSVEMDARGNFCMEFRDRPSKDDQIFWHPDAPKVRVVASSMTLLKVGGATIDFREGRFKLDLPITAKMPCSCNGDCGCAKPV